MATTEISISPEMIAEAVRKAMESLAETNGTATVAAKPTTGKLDAKKDYPLGEKRPDLVRSATGLSVNEITLDKAVAGKLTFDALNVPADQRLSLRRRSHSPRNPGVSGADLRERGTAAPGKESSPGCRDDADSRRSRSGNLQLSAAVSLHQAGTPGHCF